MAHDRQGPSLNLRVWLFLALGVITGGGLVFEFVRTGEYAKATLAGLLCGGCLAGIAWALDSRA